MNNYKRQSNFELLRIVCMVMIVTLHTLMHGGAIRDIDIKSVNFILTHLLESISIIAVNCYVLITGYFGINSSFKINKMVNLYLQVLFYSVTISVIFWITNLQRINISSIINTIFPITTQVWWFMSIFLILYILTPYLNKLLSNLDFTEYTNLLVILIIVFVLWPSLIIKFKPLDTTGGFSLYNFIVLYIVGAYINKFYKCKKFNKKKLVILYTFSTITLWLLNVIISQFKGYNYNIYNYNFILVFISCVSVFLIFKEIEIQSKVINKFSTLTLGIYLIHDHPYVRSYIYNALDYKEYFDGINFFMYTIYIVILIYTVSSIIEYFRQCIFKFMYEYQYKLIRNISKLIKK